MIAELVPGHEDGECGVYSPGRVQKLAWGALYRRVLLHVNLKENA